MFQYTRQQSDWNAEKLLCISRFTSLLMQIGIGSPSFQKSHHHWASPAGSSSCWWSQAEEVSVLDVSLQLHFIAICYFFFFFQGCWNILILRTWLKRLFATPPGSWRGMLNELCSCYFTFGCQSRAQFWLFVRMRVELIPSCLNLMWSPIPLAGNSAASCVCCTSLSITPVGSISMSRLWMVFHPIRWHRLLWNSLSSHNVRPHTKAHSSVYSAVIRSASTSIFSVIPSLFRRTSLLSDSGPSSAHWTAAPSHSGSHRWLAPTQQICVLSDDVLISCSIRALCLWLLTVI